MSSDEDSVGAVLVRKKKKVINSSSHRRSTLPARRRPSQHQTQQRRSTHTGAPNGHHHHAADPPTTNSRIDENHDDEDDLMSSIRPPTSSSSSRNDHHHHHHHHRHSNTLQRRRAHFHDRENGIRVPNDDSNHADGIRIRGSDNNNNNSSLHNSSNRRRSTGEYHHDDGIRVTSSTPSHSGSAIRNGESLNSVYRRRSTGMEHPDHQSHHSQQQHHNNIRRSSLSSSHSGHNHHNHHHRSSLVKNNPQDPRGGERVSSRPQLNRRGAMKASIPDNIYHHDNGNGMKLLNDSVKRLNTNDPNNQYYDTLNRTATSGTIKRSDNINHGISRNNNNNMARRSSHHSTTSRYHSNHLPQTIDENELMMENDDMTKATKSSEVARRSSIDCDDDTLMGNDDDNTIVTESKSSEARRFGGFFRNSTTSYEVMRRNNQSDDDLKSRVSKSMTSNTKKKKNTGGRSFFTIGKGKKKKNDIPDNSRGSGSDESDTDNNDNGTNVQKVDNNKKMFGRRNSNESSIPMDYDNSNNKYDTKGRMKDSSSHSYHTFLSKGKEKQKEQKRPKTPEPKIIKLVHPQGLLEPWIHRRGSLNLERPNQKVIFPSNELYQTKGIKFRENDKYVPQKTQNLPKISRYGFVLDEFKESNTSSTPTAFTEQKCMESALYPTVLIASMEMDAMRHRHLVQLARRKKNLHQKKEGNKKDDLSLPTHRYFPKDCLQILRLLAGNDRCIDCGTGGNVHYLRRRRDGKHVMEAEEIKDGSNHNENDLVWASLAHGTMLCNQCAFRHITKSEEKQFKDTGNVKSLTEGEWSLIDVIRMLEGGNHKFLTYVDDKTFHQQRSSKEIPCLLGSTSIVKASQGADSAYNAAYDSKYKSKRVAAYRKTISLSVEKISALHGCDGSKPIRKPQYMNSPTYHNAQTAAGFASSNQPEDSKTSNHSHDDTFDNYETDADGIRVFSESQVFDINPASTNS